MSYFVHSGELSSGIVISSWDDMYVLDGGTATSITVNEQAGLYVSEGASALKVRENGGYVEVNDGATATFVSNSFSGLELSGRVTVHSGTTANANSMSYGSVCVYSGGTANSTTMRDDGEMFVYSAGAANSTVVDSNGEMYVSGGGVAKHTTVNSNGELYVLAGGTANSITLRKDGKVFVDMGGAALNVDWTPGAGYLFADSARVSFTSDHRGVRFASDGAPFSSARTVRSAVVSAGRSICVMNGGAVSTATVNKGGVFCVYSGGTAVSIRENGGVVTVASGADATFVANTINGLKLIDSAATLHSGTTANSTVVSYGALHIFAGGLANSTTTSDGDVYVYMGGTANFTKINYGEMEVFSGGVANDTTVVLGAAYVKGGAANRTVVSSQGDLYVHEGGTANSITVNSSGCVTVFGGGKITGRLTLAAGAEVWTNDGSIVDFDVSGAAPGDAARINDLSLVTGLGSFTVTVSAMQKAGVYTLANGAKDFSETITVNSDTGIKLGTLAVGGGFTSYGYTYSLARKDGTLSLTVAGDGLPLPAAPTVSADVTAATNKNVTVTASFGADAATKQYSLDHKTWRTYTTGVVMKENGKVYFRALNALGGASTVASFTVANIDRVAPDKPTATADITVATDRNVTVTAVFSADSARKQYSLDNKKWQAYTSGVVFSKNGTVYFRGIDAAGNVSEVASCTVSNITTSPEPIDPTDPTKLSWSGKVAFGAETVLKPKLSASGRYTVNGTFAGRKGSVTVVNAAGQKVASGTVKNGAITFKKDLLLDNDYSYGIVVKNTDRKGDASAYSVTLAAKELFTKIDNTDDSVMTPKKLAATPAAQGAAGSVNDWVGYGDAVDYWSLGVSANGGFYDLDIYGVSNNVKLTVYAPSGKKLKGVSLSSKKSSAKIANICLTKNSYAVVEAPKAAKGQNSDYKLLLTERATLTGTHNNDWRDAEVLEKGASFSGALTKAPGGDSVDYCDISKLNTLTFDMKEGKAKVSFFDANEQAIKIAEITMANGSAKKNAASLTLAAGNATTDHFSITAIGPEVKYMKIEASGKTLNSYSIGNIA